MSSIPIPDSSISLEFQIDELTKGTADGNGVFDVMLKAVKSHLREEFDAERIRGTDYANVFSQSLTQVMAQATQYALAKSKMGLELQLLEAQIGKLAADTVLTTKQAALLEAQITTENANAAMVLANTRQTDYQTNFILPAQLEATEAQTSLVTVQEAQVVQQTLNTVAQRDQIDEQTKSITADTKLKDVQWDMLVFERDFKQAVELESIQSDITLKEKQLALSDKEILVKQAQIDLATKDILLKQNQIDLGTKELLVKQAQLDLSSKDLLLKAEQILLTKYELANKLPAEVALTTSQKSFYDQKTKTEKAQVDGSDLTEDSVLAYNNNLIQEQSKTFLRSAQQTAAKLLIDTWIVRNQNDPDGNRADANNKLEDTTIGKAVQSIMSGIDVTIV